MFHEEYTALCNAGVAKNNLLKKNPLGYFISSMVAGMFISFGSMVAFVLGQSMDGNGAAAAVKLIQSIAFASALSLVVMAGAELFTGNNLVMAAASLRKKVSWADTVKLWCVCWIGNLIASLLCVAAFQLTGLPTAGDGAIADYFIKISSAKVSLGVGEILVRAILCNILVCLAVWCGTKMKTESGKLIMIFWCILIFMTCGFEHRRYEHHRNRCGKRRNHCRSVSVYRTAGNSRKYNRRGSVCGSTVSCDFKRKIKKRKTQRQPFGRWI